MRSFAVCTVHLLRVIRCRILRWADHLARMEGGRGAFKMLTDTRTENRRRWKNWIDSVQNKDYWIAHWISGLHKP